jgi:hypothetical protein
MMLSPNDPLPISFQHPTCQKNITVLNKCIHYGMNFKIFLENPEEDQRLNTMDTKDSTKGHKGKDFNLKELGRDRSRPGRSKVNSFPH